MKLLGLSPARIFSGFETSFFDAVEARGTSIERVAVEIPWFRALCTLTSISPNRKLWATRRDLHYHTTATAFRLKSAVARRCVAARARDCDAVYQVGGLWNPIRPGSPLPLFLQVDYTTSLSNRRRSEWRRREGRQQEFWIEQEKILFRTAAVVLTTTENARASIINDYGIDPAHVVTVGAGVSAPYDRLEPGRVPAYGSKRILFVGRGFHGKGLDTLLAAFPRIRAAVPDARLTVIGPSELSINVPGVDYLGRIADRTRVRELYYQHALFAMPSRFEPLGQVFLEAMSCRLPCIGSTVDAMPELIDHGRTGYVIPLDDVDSLVAYAVEILSRPDLAHRLGGAGFDKLRATYTWPIVGAKIVGEMQRHLNPRGGPA